MSWSGQSRFYSSGRSKSPLGTVQSPKVCAMLRNINRQKINLYSCFLSMLASSQCSGQSGISCGGNSAGYSPWGPPAPHQYGQTEHFYNNPIQYPTSNNGNGHRYPMTPTGQQPPASLPGAFFHQTPAGRNVHNHYPTSHAHTGEYQPFPQNGRKCNGSR